MDEILPLKKVGATVAPTEAAQNMQGCHLLILSNLCL